MWERRELHVWRKQLPEYFVSSSIALRHFPAAIISCGSGSVITHRSCTYEHIRSELEAHKTMVRSTACLSSSSSSALPAPVVVPFLDDHIEIAIASSIEDAVSAALRQDALEEAQLGAVCSALRLEVENNQ